MPPRTDLILFGDLETTGVEEGQDNIIEVGLALYSWPAFEEIDSFTSIVVPNRAARARMEDTQVVRDMHRVNGLSDEIDALLHNLDAMRPYLIEEVDDRIVEWLKPHGTSHIPIGGSGFCHFDRRFTRRYLPKFDKLITHWVLDVGVLRRAWQYAGKQGASDEAKTHRALDDARVHAGEWAFYMEQIRSIPNRWAPPVVPLEYAERRGLL